MECKTYIVKRKAWADGDFTGNGYVDGLDYLLWSGNCGPVVPAVPPAGNVGGAVVLLESTVLPDGGFLPAQDVVVGDAPTDIVSADFNGDGRADLAVANLYDGDVSVLYSLSGGGFGGRLDVAAGKGPYGIVSADFNGDGRPDLAVTNCSDDDVSVLYGLSGGDFGGRQDLPVGDRPEGITSADFNGDGRPDLAVTNCNDDNVSVLYARVDDAAPGDANDDGVVDGLDYLVWSTNYNQSGVWADGDFTGNGYVDGLDYVVWSNNYGPVVPAAASTGMVGDAVDQEVAATAAAQLPKSSHVGEAGGGTVSGSPALPASLAAPTRDVSVWPAGESSELAVPLPAGGWSVSAVPLSGVRAAAPAGVPEEVERVVLTDTGAAGMRSPSHGLAALEDDLVDILGLAQLEAPLHT